MAEKPNPSDHQELYVRKARTFLADARHLPAEEKSDAALDMLSVMIEREAGLHLDGFPGAARD